MPAPKKKSVNHACATKKHVRGRLAPARIAISFTLPTFIKREKGDAGCRAAYNSTSRPHTLVAEGRRH